MERSIQVLGLVGISFAFIEAICRHSGNCICEGDHCLECCTNCQNIANDFKNGIGNKPKVLSVEQEAFIKARFQSRPTVK